MNRNLINKVIEAIKENKTDYAMGILDTIMEGLPEDTSAVLKTPIVIPQHVSKSFPETVTSDDGAQLQAEARAKMNNIDLSAISQG